MAWDNPEVSADASTMINELIDRKKKMDGYKRWQFICTMGMLSLLLVCSYYFYNRVLMPSRSVWDIIDTFAANRLVVSAFVLLVTVYCLMSFFAKKYLEQKGKYDALRAEIIVFFQYGPWSKTKGTAIHDLISRELKELFDINLTYKS
ncbi:DUF2663 family protein [Paenibacillus cremeus]|uniref:DUF2663 family protein n=1 Tax=Paenibacillus cremeus TaxID=2163881 RepID=A0A559KH82_9BACL|nr:DUF2663 family protein [Paenibacillus cremeus]TVY11481.1 DUF2663 family protein [Paenibacillus cremeus]